MGEYLNFQIGQRFPSGGSGVYLKVAIVSISDICKSTRWSSIRVGGSARQSSTLVGQGASAPLSAVEPVSAALHSFPFVPGPNLHGSVDDTADNTVQLTVRPSPRPNVRRVDRLNFGGRRAVI
jgi:hypothetical protein